MLGGINLYTYAPNPLTWIDPLGLYKGEGQHGLGKYHVFHEQTLNPEEYTMTDKEHFSRANESAYKRLQTDAEFKREMQTKYPGVVDHVQLMRNGNFSGSPIKVGHGIMVTRQAHYNFLILMTIEAITRFITLMEPGGVINGVAELHVENKGVLNDSYLGF